VGVTVGVALGVAVEVGVGVGVGVTDGCGVGITTPLFHTSLEPLFIQVYFLPRYVEVSPAFLQLAPALTAAVAFKGIRKANITMNAIRDFFMG
jgi:hypothetical protein